MSQRCDGGSCTSGVRCGVHAALYAREAMTAKGFIALDEVRALSDVSRDVMLQLAKAVGFECMRWVIKWEPRMKTLLEGWYVTRHYAAPLAIYAGRLNPHALESLLRYVKFNPYFAESMHAALITGGMDAVDLMLDDQLPGLVVIKRAP